jgi:hypothetical protein
MKLGAPAPLSTEALIIHKDDGTDIVRANTVDSKATMNIIASKSEPCRVSEKVRECGGALHDVQQG